MLFEKAVDIAPQLAHAKIIDHWAGLRPGTTREAPIIDRLPHHSNGYICAGHFRYGLVSAPGTAQLITDIILNQKSSLDRALFRWES